MNLIQITLKIPAEAEERVKMMAMVAVERYLRAKKKDEVDAIEQAIEADLTEIKKTNNITLDHGEL